MSLFVKSLSISLTETRILLRLLQMLLFFFIIILYNLHPRDCQVGKAREKCDVKG